MQTRISVETTLHIPKLVSVEYPRHLFLEERYEVFFQRIFLPVMVQRLTPNVHLAIILSVQLPMHIHMQDWQPLIPEGPSVEAEVELAG